MEGDKNSYCPKRYTNLQLLIVLTLNLINGYGFKFAYLQSNTSAR